MVGDKMQKKEGALIFYYRLITLMMLMSLGFFTTVLFAAQKWNLNQVLFQEMMSAIEVQILFGVGVLVLVARTPIANHILKNSLQNVDFGDRLQLLKASFSSHIVRLAMAEAAALFGFVINLLHNESTSFLILGIAGAFAILREWPTYDSVKRRAELVQSLRRTGRT